MNSLVRYLIMRYTFERKGKITDSYFLKIPFLTYMTIFSTHTDA